eukprot:CAMPEP_0116887928 /NCGR_PEP_ID=MMETSP0463-20121206/22648_1 /TAXON_ID=181622 /ORGANISM="Strombidinopsis sp, Strain SopsisLIS2011" /LENGTH=93 /DNA_ID=CAMNT_0004551579 /DNA_START=331 /DNA_END=612 /DNA_ORIENTATION=-
MTRMIKSMCKEHIKSQETVILYTTTCSADLNTGEAYAIAKEVDPHGERTLIVATKIDRREKGFITQFEDMQSGLGIVCVRNRTQEEVDNKISF